MMIYMGEVWPILAYREDGCFEGKHPMGWWKLGKVEMVSTKKGTYRHMTYRGVWENNPSQEYQLVCPD